MLYKISFLAVNGCMHFLKLFYQTGIFLFFAQIAVACPQINRLIDFNCDQQLKIAITGDSIVWGLGDEEDKGGYVGRLRTIFPKAEVDGVSIRGISSTRLFRAFKQNLSNRSTTWERTIHSDVIIISVGINDYFEEIPAETTVRNIRRLVSFLKNSLKKEDVTAPMIVISTLTHTNRGYQQPFVNKVNAMLLKQNSPTFPVIVRLDKLSSMYLGEDGLHPTAAGYDQLAKYVSADLKGVIKKRCALLRHDADKDLIYDLFEPLKFFTDPTISDTDGDGIFDGVEVFTRNTDPLDPNSF